MCHFLPVLTSSLYRSPCYAGLFISVVDLWCRLARASMTLIFNQQNGSSWKYPSKYGTYNCTSPNYIALSSIISLWSPYKSHELTHTCKLPTLVRHFLLKCGFLFSPLAFSPPGPTFQHRVCSDWTCEQFTLLPKNKHNFGNPHLP